MESDQGKLFVGGISWETSEEKLKDYFGQYGDVFQVSIMRDKITGRPRGFGFVLFSDPSVVDRVIQDKHTFDGRPVEAKRAMSREEQQDFSRSGNNNGSRNVGAGGNVRTKKIFVGGLPSSLTEEFFREYFEGFGSINDVVIMYDQNTQRPRGFGFVTFDSEDAVDRVLQKTFHDLNGKQVEVKCAFPKGSNSGMTNRRGDDGSGGNYGYNSSGNQNAYGSRMDSSRYMQTQNPGGAYPPYGSSEYGTSGYGYGVTNNGMTYTGYSGYGGGNPGYGGPTSAAYGNPNNAAYGNDPQGAPRSSWNAQTAPGYGNEAPWGGAGGSNGGPTGQSPGGASGYGNQGYGYGSYVGNDGSYGDQTNYGNTGIRGGGGGNASGGAGGDLQGNMGAYGGGYGDGNGHGGYGSGNYGVPANGAHGAQMGYGTGYGGAQNRQG